MKDLIEELMHMGRAVGSASLPAGEAKVVTLRRTYPATPADVWDAITDPARIARWFLPVHGDLRLGGTYQLQGNAGGEIRVCDAPRHLQVTWVMGDAPPDSSFVDAELAPVDGGTELTLRHTAVVPPEMWDGFGPGAVGVGWDLALLSLVTHVGGASLGDPAELEVDPTMRAAMTASAAAWGVAYAASGADPETVSTTTAATLAFYVPNDDEETR